MIDVMMDHHGSKDIATYARGRTIIEYALCTPNIATAVEKCDYEPFNHHLTSNHRGFFLDINTPTLFGSETNVSHAWNFETSNPNIPNL